MGKTLETFYDTIYGWVKDNFGTEEADDPSWDIHALAKHLSESNINPNELSDDTKHCVYRALDQHYLEEDVADYAEQHGYTLTEAQRQMVADEIRNSEWYCSIDAEDMEWYINQELKRG